MAISSITELVRELTQGPLLSAARREELDRLQTSFTDPRGLARELIQRGWLTPYQINQLFQGRGQDLVLGPYVLLERLGEGGMGEVFKAHHTFLNRAAALKLISKAHLGAGGGAERFLMEMQLVAQLDHPHIVRALDAGLSGARYYLAMELIDGVTLGRLVQQRGPLPVAQACACIGQAALGLQHASEHGLVHRDIKPSNLMLSVPRSSTPVVKVLDLGLARLQGGDASRDLTRTGTLMGTLDYLAPEQALDPRAVDVRADIYALGCTFFFLLTGRPPFDGGTEAQKLLRHQQQEPPAIESLRPDVPPAVAAVLRQMLAKRPEQRFAAPAEVAAALQPFASWEGGLPARGAVPAGAAGGASLIEQQAGTAERGWTLMVDPTRMAPGKTMAVGAPTTAFGAPATALGQPSNSGLGLSIPPTASPPTAAHAAPSLVTARAAPERGWTLLAEPEAPHVAAPVPAKVDSRPAAPQGLRRLTRLPLPVRVGVAAVLLLLVGVGLVRLCWPSTSPTAAVVDNSDNRGKDKDKGPRVEPKKNGEPKTTGEKEKDKEALPKERPLVIEPDQPMSIPRTGDFVFPAYASRYFAMADKQDNDTWNVYDITTMKVIRSFNAVRGMEGQRVLSTDGRWLAGKVGNKIRVCNAETGQVRTIPLPAGRVDWLGFAGRDRLVVLRSGEPGRGIEVWDLKTEKVALALPLPGGCAGDRATVNPDGQLLVLPQKDQLLVQELREGAPASVRSLPTPMGKFALGGRGLAFSQDSNSLAGLFEETFLGWRVISWDVQKGTLKSTFTADHSFPKTLIEHQHFYGGPAVEWVPGGKGWVLYGQQIIDAKTGKVRGAFPRNGPFNQPVLRALTSAYGVECTGTEVRIIPWAWAPKE